MKEGGSRRQGAAAASPCAACKLLRRRCAEDCLFAPYFPADEPHKFATVHKVFGASNVNKMLQELPEQRRGDAVSSMVYEASARLRDPVYGCVGAISVLQQEIHALQKQLALAQAEVVYLQMHQSHLTAAAAAAASPSVPGTAGDSGSEYPSPPPPPSSSELGAGALSSSSSSSRPLFSLDIADFQALINF